MGQPIFPLEVWTSQITQASIPANENSLRVEVLEKPAIAIESAQPATPAEDDVYVIGAAPTGEQWAGFDEGDVAIYKGGTWLAFSPFEGWVKSILGVLYSYVSGVWVATGGGGGGATTFLELTDTPTEYVAGYKVVVNTAGDALEFVEDSGGGGGATTFLELTDTPTEYVAGYKVVVNAGGDALEFVEDSGGGGAQAWLKVSDDFTAPSSSAGGNQSMAIGPGSSTISSSAEVFSISSSDHYMADGYILTNDEVTGISSGDNIQVLGFPESSSVTLNNYGLNDPIETDTVIMETVVNWTIGQMITVANSAGGVIDGEYEIYDIVTPQTYRFIGLNTNDTDLTGATFTGTVESPNGEYEVSYVYPNQVTLIGWTYSDPDGNGGLATFQKITIGKAMAIGQGAQASADRAVAIGADTVADQPDTVAVGGRKITGLLNGSEAQDAATMGQIWSSAPVVLQQSMLSVSISSTPAEVKYDNTMFSNPSTGTAIEGSILIMTPGTGGMSRMPFSAKVYCDNVGAVTISDFILDRSDEHVDHAGFAMSILDASPDYNGWYIEVSDSGSTPLVSNLHYSIQRVFE